MRKALNELPGVAHVETDATAQTATLTVDPKKFDSQQAIATLADAGYEGGSVVEKTAVGGEE